MLYLALTSPLFILLIMDWKFLSGKITNVDYQREHFWTYFSPTKWIMEFHLKQSQEGNLRFVWIRWFTLIHKHYLIIPGHSLKMTQQRISISQPSPSCSYLLIPATREPAATQLFIPAPGGSYLLFAETHKRGFSNSKKSCLENRLKPHALK